MDNTERQSEPWLKARLIVPGVWLLFLVLVGVINFEPGLSSVMEVQTFFFLGALLAVPGMLISIHPLSQVARRVPSGRAGRRVRQFWIPVTVVPFLSIIALSLAWTGVGPEPLLSQVARWIAAVSAGYLGWGLLSRMGSMVGWELTRARRSEGVDTPALGQLGWRSRATRKLKRVAADLTQALESRGLEVTATTRAPGDRDVHIRLDAEELVVYVYRGLLVLSGKAANLSRAAENRLRDDLGDEFRLEHGAAGWELIHSGTRSAAVAGLDLFLDACKQEGELEPGFMHDTSAGDPRFDCQLRSRQGHSVRWRSDGTELRIESKGCAPMIFDLDRSFRLLVSRSPEGSAPMLNLLLRQSNDDTGSAAAWQEARLRVPLRHEHPRLDDLPEEVVDAPVLLRPSDFADLWNGLFWCAHGVGTKPKELPALELGAATEPPPELAEAPRRQPSGSGCLPLLLGGITAIMAFGFLIALGSTMVIWPVVEMSTNGWYVLVGLVGLWLLLRYRSWWPSGGSMSRYLFVAREELTRLADAFAGQSVPTLITQSGKPPGKRSFFSDGRTVDLRVEVPGGLAFYLHAWPAGFRPNGAAVAERLEISGDRSSGAADKLRQVIRVLERNEVEHQVSDEGGSLTLTLETRRILGGGASAWHSLIGLVCDTLTPKRVPGHIRRSLPDTVTPAPRISDSGVARVTQRHFRGVKAGLATLGLTCIVLGFPVIHPDSWPLPSDSKNGFNHPDGLHRRAIPDGDLARQCPEATSVYTSVAELRCLANAADYTQPLSSGSWLNLTWVFRPERYTSVIEIGDNQYRSWPPESAPCEQFEEWVDELGSDRWHGFVDELLRRTRKIPRWVNENPPVAVADLDRPRIQAAGDKCHVPQENIDRVFQLEAKYRQSFRQLQRN